MGDRDKPRPLGDHLEDLRRVVFRAAIAVCLAVGICFVMFGDQLVGFCLAPLHMTSPILGKAPIPPDAAPGTGPRLITIKALDRFKLIMVAAAVGGIVISAPYVLWLLWGFISVGMFPHERRLVYTYLPAAFLLFLTGAAFGYFIMLPLAIDFLLHFGEGSGGMAGIQTDLLVSDYLTYFFTMTVVVGCVFEIPLIITVLVRVTDITPDMMRKARRYVVVIALVIGMLMTPPDPLSQMMVATPVIFLYEIGLLFAGRAHRKKLAARAAVMDGPNPWDEILGPTPPDDLPPPPPPPAGGPADPPPTTPDAAPAAAAPTPAPAPAAQSSTTTPGPAVAEASFEPQPHPADIPLVLDDEDDDEPGEMPVDRPAPRAPWAAAPPTPEATDMVDASEPPAPSDATSEPLIRSSSEPMPPSPPVFPFAGAGPFSRSDEPERYQLTRDEIAELVRYELELALSNELPRRVADEVRRVLDERDGHGDSGKNNGNDVDVAVAPPVPSAPAPETDDDAGEREESATMDTPVLQPVPAERLRDNLDNVRTRIAAAAARSGRSAGEITLCAVSKTATADDVRSLVALGVTHFGENRLQVAEPKLAALSDLRDSVNWHMIGHVQRNKAKRLVELFDTFHTVDSARLADTLDKLVAGTGRRLPIMIEINSGEDQKNGIAAADAEALADHILSLPGLELTGLMTMAPFVDDPDLLRRCFAALRDLRDRLATGVCNGRCELHHLSMGMTNDFEIAIEEGATIVRIGSALFATD